MNKTLMFCLFMWWLTEAPAWPVIIVFVISWRLYRMAYDIVVHPERHTS